jgi:hypothetical protein
MAVTASSDWSVRETIGQDINTPQGQAFRPGVFLQAIRRGEWLVIDELNRADFDRAFGPLFTVLAGQPVTLPHTEVARQLSIVPPGAAAPPDTDAIRVPEPWRMVATMNEFDKANLHRLSYALMRRFAFIEVEAPPDGVIRSLVAGPGELIADLLPVRQFVELGAALFMDAALYAARRSADGEATRSRVLFESFYSYVLPQLEQLDDLGARELFEVLSPNFEPAEVHALRRAIRKVLGSGPEWQRVPRGKLVAVGAVDGLRSSDESRLGVAVS